MATRRDEGKYEAILQAAVRVIAQTGYYHAQVSRIAKAAGVADGTIYLYFKNKEDILVSVLRRAIEQIVERARDILSPSQSAANQLHAVVQLYFAELGGNPDLAMVTQVHLRQVDVKIRRTIGDIMKPFYNLLDRIVDEGVREGTFRPSLDKRIARRMIFGTMDETVTAWVLTGGKYDLSSLTNDVVDVLLHGVQGKGRDHA